MSEPIEKIVHNLAGAAGTFGFVEVHNAAAHLDDHFHANRKITALDLEPLIRALREL